MGRGFPIVSSTKQKLNTRSSTESELVGVDDMMSSILWTRYFLKEQGYNVFDNIIFQDNRSSILLERNGKLSSGKRTKHINVRYFFITDRISKGEVRVEWCSTKKMVADFMTKPLQGSIFKKFRDLIMGSLSMDEAAKLLTRDAVRRTIVKVWHRRTCATGVCWTTFSFVHLGRRTDDEECVLYAIRCRSRTSEKILTSLK